MGIFDGVLICTDLDGTLLRRDHTISAENLRAIEHFKANGGIFTFITGRMPFYAAHFCETIKPNAPFGCVNGAGVYDQMRREYLWTASMPHTVKELIACIDERFPQVGIQVNTFYKTYFCKENRVMERFRKSTKLENLTCHYADVQEPIAKIIFGSEDNEEILAMAEALNRHPMADAFSFVRSEYTLYEILPKDIGKGTAIREMCRCLNMDLNKTVAIGDYNNDISMFRAAKLGIAVANACEDAKRAADVITVSNEEHAIAQVIADLESGKYKL